jgi:RND superfamily putative drug exporter
MQLLGDWNWWLPPFLRWLPQIAIEGQRPEAEAGASAGASAEA